METMAAVTTVCIVVGIAVFALIAYFVIKRKARPYDHLNLKNQSYHCYRDPQTSRPTAPASSTDEETYEEVCDDPKVQVPAYEGIVSMRPHPGNRPTHSPKNRSLFPSNKRRCKEDKPDGQTPVTKTTITKTFSNKDRSIKAPTTQSDEYLEPVLAAKEKEQTLERPSSSHCNYYSYPSIACNNQHPSNSSRSSKQQQ
ncbi:uncharacterized protein LOC112568285 [Pomacea canaliculata]|nr:uncharacterized protein LOC112568285 [Pomacea canaliculata]